MSNSSKEKKLVTDVWTLRSFPHYGNPCLCCWHCGASDETIVTLTLTFLCCRHYGASDGTVVCESKVTIAWPLIILCVLLNIMEPATKRFLLLLLPLLFCVVDIVEPATKRLLLLLLLFCVVDIMEPATKRFLLLLWPFCVVDIMEPATERLSVWAKWPSRDPVSSECRPIHTRHLAVQSVPDGRLTGADRPLLGADIVLLHHRQRQQQSPSRRVPLSCTERWLVLLLLYAHRHRSILGAAGHIILTPVYKRTSWWRSTTLNHQNNLVC
jgi:hypothetical protein